MTNEERFRAVFAENVRRRSRTAKGLDKGSETSAKKKGLLLAGEALAARTAENVGRLIDDVWANRLALREGDFSRETTPEELPIRIRRLCERWYDIASDGLVDQTAYDGEFEALSELHRRVEKYRPLPWGLNHRYRLWTPGYTTLQVHPLLLEEQMADFYRTLARLLRRNAHEKYVIGGSGRSSRHPLPLARTVAYADVMMDGELHPWLDGCSRVSTALMLWITASFDDVPPLFNETKSGHYGSIRDLDQHERYVSNCMDRTRDRY